MIKNKNIYLVLVLLLVLIVIDSFLTEDFVLAALSTAGIGLAIYQIRVNEDVRLVIIKNKIKRKYSKRNLKDYYVIFLEISNLSTYSQFYNLKLSDHIISETIALLRKKFHNNVFLYSSDQLIILEEFETKTVINQKLRNDEQYDKALRLVHFLERHKFQYKNKQQFYQIKTIVGTGSTGIRGDYNTIDDMIKLAHFAMIKAKEDEKKIVIATEELRIIKEDVDVFNMELEEGLKYDEIVPYFLPILDPDTMRIIGCESLLRWEKSDYRVIEASKFKRVAEEKNLFEELDRVIVNKTFQAYKEWLNDKLIDDDFIITINLGLQTLKTNHIPELIAIAREYGIPHANIEIDISEHDLSDGDTIEVIYRLKEQGFRVAVDAFHTNNEFIKSIMDVGIDTIKLDRVLMPEDDTDNNQYRFYRMLVRLTKIMGYRVMAKGIENKVQLSLAKDLNIDFVQGYYITPPLNDIKIRGFLNKYHSGIPA